MSLLVAAGGTNVIMIPTPFLDAQNQLDKRKALNVIVLSMTVRTFNRLGHEFGPLLCGGCLRFRAACTFSGCSTYVAAGRTTASNLGTSGGYHATTSVH